MSVVHSYAGKLGDALMQFPITFWYHRQTGKQVRLWLDEKSLKPLVPLFESQPCVEAVELKPGIENYSMGGQPWHFGMETKDYAGHSVSHLGYRSFPVRQLTLECMDQCKVPLNVSPSLLAETPCLVTTPAPKARRVLLHGQGICAHSRTTPLFWKFLHSIAGELEERFDEIVFIGSEDDRAVGLSAYPGWRGFDDGGDFSQVADYMAASELVIGCGSSMVALAGAIKTASVRVHDPIGNDLPRVIWNCLGANQLNATELELREMWPRFREKWLAQPTVEALGEAAAESSL